MFISPAHAQTPVGAPGGMDFIVQLIPLLLIFVIFYFFLIRPQQKKAREHAAMLAAIRRGDTVITQGGMYAKIVKVADAELEAEIASGVKVRLVKGTIAQVVSKTEPAANDN